MHEIEIGDYRLENDGDALVIRPLRGRSMREARFDRSEIRDLMDFLRMSVEEEFNQRASFRVPVLASSGITAVFIVARREIPVQLRNVSFVGLYAEVPPAKNPNLDKGAILDVRLEYRQESLTLRGVVRRRAMNGYGVFFPQTIQNEDLAPPPLLRSVVQRLQKRALRALGDATDSVWP